MEKVRILTQQNAGEFLENAQGKDPDFFCC